jgi:hypothetical protein
MSDYCKECREGGYHSAKCKFDPKRSPVEGTAVQLACVLRPASTLVIDCDNCKLIKRLKGRWSHIANTRCPVCGAVV